MTKSHNKKELLLIAVVWILVFASAPLYSYYTHLSIHKAFDWQEVLSQWSNLSAFLLLFLLNHFILIPKFIASKRFLHYTFAIIIAMGIFVTFLNTRKPNGPLSPRGMPPRKEVVDKQRRPDEPQFSDRRQLLLLDPPDLARMAIALLMIGVDLGGIALLNEQKMRERLLRLEQQNLKQELDHLRYQINPHFFMNTLNNIHVLIDIDRERAKRAIVELSGLMRYALYEGNGSLVPLYREVEFLRLYISLMKLRFNNKVEIVCDMPETAPAEVQIPPLLLATFVENAFKHGVSYQQKSFIYVRLSLDPVQHNFRFQCVNSKHTVAVTNDGHHGIGLENVRKRLDLQYGKDYRLVLEDSSQKQFSVDLTLPIEHII